MATKQVLPITDLQQFGIIKDTPAVKLPPNAFSDLENIRISDGALHKIQGESEIFSGLSWTDIRYVAWWPAPSIAPNDGHYIVVDRVSGMDELYRVQASTGTKSPRLAQMTVSDNWQHTLFSGGYAIILNNGIDVPRYLLDNDQVSDISAFELPGWDSYLVSDPIIDITYDGYNPEFDLGFLADFTSTTIQVFTSRSGVANVSQTFSSNGTQSTVTVATESDSNTTSVTFSGLQADDIVRIFLVSNSVVSVRAGVVRAYGDLLVAGNLRETSGSAIIRNLPGVVRTSDVAPAGSIPANWNPFRIGAGTADEFVMSSTGIIQDMAEIQGTLMIYTNNSIHSLRPTGNVNIPFTVQNITDAYGAQTMGSVLEFDGKHLVVGSNDVYIFPGHPGNIQSVADDRVRKDILRSINAATEEKLFILRNTTEDEIWICYPEVNQDFPTQAHIWNYRDNTWTRRKISEMRSGVLAPLLEGTEVNVNKLRPLFCTGSEIYYADADTYTGINGAYNSGISREKLAITPEFDTESIGSIAMLTQGDSNLNIRIVSSNTPGELVDYTSVKNSANVDFDTIEDYKVDVRINGRFLSYQIDDNSGTTAWTLSGMQMEIMKGGRR